MPKLKSPFLSLGAQGSIGDALTFQKSGQSTIARSKPTPSDPYSLAQAYQRWDYKDYAYLWTLNSEAVKQSYRTRASRYHITGFSLWMRENLKALTDIAARWHLDEKTGATVFDSSKQGNNATIFGATPSAGIIDTAYSFDGINDSIRGGIVTPLVLSTFEFYLNTAHAAPLNAGLIGFISPFHAVGFSLISNRPLLLLNGNNYQYFVDVRLLYLDSHWHCWHLYIAGAAQNDIDNCSLTIDGNPIAKSGLPVKTVAPDPWVNLNIGGTSYGNLAGIIDSFSLYTRQLPATLMLRHSLRRYPS